MIAVSGEVGQYDSQVARPQVSGAVGPLVSH